MPTWYMIMPDQYIRWFGKLLYIWVKVSNVKKKPFRWLSRLVWTFVRSLWWYTCIRNVGYLGLKAQVVILIYQTICMITISKSSFRVTLAIFSIMWPFLIQYELAFSIVRIVRFRWRIVILAFWIEANPEGFRVRVSNSARLTCHTSRVVHVAT